MKIQLKNCNSIISGTVEIIPNTLNIKYGINGTGKSTIAKAIEIGIQDRIKNKNEILSLTPFSNSETSPKLSKIEGIDKINSSIVFNEQYINNFIFKEDELIEGSFDIFIKNEKYDAGLKKINDLTNQLQNKLSTDPDIRNIVNDFSEISSSFGNPTQAGLINGNSGIAKAFKGGNKVTNIPAELAPFKTFIQHSTNHKWLRWQLDGSEFLNLSNDCPFCVSDTTQKKELISKISKIYDPKSIENLGKIISIFDRLKKYFTESTQEKISAFVKNINGYAEDESQFLIKVKADIDDLKAKFISAQNIGFSALKEVGKIVETINNHKIDINSYAHLNSPETKEKINLVNSALNDLVSVATELQKHVATHKSYVESVIKNNQNNINQFLRNAGYSYEVELAEEQETYKLKLSPTGAKKNFIKAGKHLSFGERNAFALVLFMHDAIKSNSDLIILDDPISSFDKNKKYAIIEMLFLTENSLRNKTVILFTHDFDPIVDLLKIHQRNFKKTNVTFLENWHGTLSEKSITRDDVQSFVDINTSNIDQSDHILQKVIYFRRYLEIMNLEGSLEFSLISSLLHKNPKPTIREYCSTSAEITEREMSATEITEATEKISRKISDFNYELLLQLVTDSKKMIALYKSTNCNYEKLHFFRVIFDDDKKCTNSNVIRKFINEAFHIENNYIFYLNPKKFQLVPQYITDACDAEIDELTSRLQSDSSSVNS